MAHRSNDLSPQKGGWHLWGAELRCLREQSGLSCRGFAKLVNYDPSTVSKAENAIRPPSLDLARACDEALHVNGTLTDLRASIVDSSLAHRLPVADRGRGWRVTSRKYVPMYLGCGAVEALTFDSSFTDHMCEWLPTRVVSVPYPAGMCTLSLFEFGVLVAEIVEERTFHSISELAVWRKTSYRAARETVAALVAERWTTLGRPAPAYVLSTYCLHDSHWPCEDDLHTAMRLLCAPGVLLDRHDGDPSAHIVAKAEVAERACFRDGFSRPDVETFGVDGVAIGYASWSGVSYLPLCPARAVPPEEIASFETVVQALWCYTNMISEVIENGDDPIVPESYGWRFLRACLSRLTAARPRETGQQRMMKDAILNTSRLTTQLVDAHTILRDMAPLAGRR